MCIRVHLRMKIAAILLGTSASAMAGIPHTLNYQGILLSGGQPVTTPTDVIFAIWDSPADGDSLWSEPRSVTPDAQGRINVLLGSVVPIPDTAFRAEAFLSVKAGTDPEMSPRNRIVAVGYSYRVGTVDGATGGVITGAVIFPDGPDTTILDPQGIVIRGAGGDEKVVYSSRGTQIYTEESTLARLEREPAALQKRVELNDDSLIFYDQAGNPTIEITAVGGAGSIVVGDGESSYTLPQGDGTAGQYLATDGAGTVSWTDPSGGVGWSEAGNYVHTTSDGDSVGIGLSSPTEKLDVAGNIHASGTISSGSSIVINGTTNEIISTSGSISFDDDNLVTEGKVSIGPGNINSGASAFVAGSGNTVNGDYATTSGGQGNVVNGARGTISGGEFNMASEWAATVAGGAGNTAGEIYSSVAGGGSNTASAPYSFVGGGIQNKAGGLFSVVGGGSYNRAWGTNSTVAGGGGSTDADSNSAGGVYSAIGGGSRNLAQGSYATVGAGYNNSASNQYTVVGGGRFNTATDLGAAVGGGSRNHARAQYSVVCGGGGDTDGDSNSALGEYSFIGGGRGNIAADQYSAVCGGYANFAGGGRGFVGGGTSNSAAGLRAVIGGGYSNDASSDHATIVGGYNQTVSGGFSTIGGGYENNIASSYSCIPGGRLNTISANAQYSMAFGTGVSVDSSRTVVLFDGTDSGSLRVNHDDGDAPVGFPIVVGTTTSNGNGAYLSAGGTWTNGSSRTFKENFRPLPPDELLAKIAALPVEVWNYKGSDERHIGPVAEDFVAAFDVGSMHADGSRDNRYLSPGDIAGVALAAVKELYRTQQELKEKMQRIEELEKQMAEMRAMVQKLIDQQ